MPAKAATPLPAVIVIQEIFGVNAHIRDVTRRLPAGYARFFRHCRPELTRLAEHMKAGKPLRAFRALAA